MRDIQIYLVTDPDLLKGKDFFDTIEKAVKGGVTLVQLREKNADTRDFIEKAVALKNLLSSYQVPLIINDRLDIAMAADADGIHIGQSDMPYEMVKALWPQEKIIGLSAENKEQVLAANALELDYIAASPLWSTATKTDTIIEWGLDGIRWIKEVSKHPLVGIGNIHADNAASVFEAGADSIAVVSEILSAEDPEVAAKTLKAIATNYRKQ